ncbi:hypothetical protein Ahu01nite_056230 [Winogradskya humida]|uniref:AraC family transcriptional regulator n=1 Tax=Winogradskya humida TaxID=113566 RepID=A0ABQ3ZV80_9ACTN|nr:hypothetical protein Ahu01nite_056230 [Actinoplanes humidus]
MDNVGFRTRRAAFHTAPRGSNEPVFNPAAPQRNPGPLTTARKVGRPDLTQLLGRTVLEARVQGICQEYALLPRTGTGLSRAYRSPSAGVELAADAHGLVTTVVLHFQPADGFTPFQGTLPAGAGSVPRRSRMIPMLGRPDETGAPYRDRFDSANGPWDRWHLPDLTLHAQYAPDAETLERLTLALPAHLPRAA